MSQPFQIITDPDVIARREARAEEYGTWECGPAPIEANGARAFNEGDPVPKSTVERYGLDKLGSVVESGTYLKKQEKEAVDRDAAEQEALQLQLDAQSPNDPAAKSTPAKKTTGSNKSEGGN